MDNDLKMFIFTLVILTGSMAVLYLVIGLRSLAKKKREIQRVLQYREKNVSEIVLTDARFGYLKGEYDCCKHTLLVNNPELPVFGGNRPALVTADDYTPDRNPAVLHALGIAYDRVPEIITGLAEAIRQDMQIFKAQDEIPSAEDIIAQISVTEFYFVFDAEMPVMQVIGGADYETEGGVITFGLNAMYKINESTWEFDAERIGG